MYCIFETNIPVFPIIALPGSKMILQLYFFLNLSTRLEYLSNVVKSYNIPLDDDFKMLLGAPTKVGPNDLRNIAKKLSVW